MDARARALKINLLLVRDSDTIYGTFYIDSTPARKISPRRSAIERQLQIITEAAKCRGEDADRLCPGPD
jgi:hypothetical protein